MRMVVRQGFYCMSFWNISFQVIQVIMFLGLCHKLVVPDVGILAFLLESFNETFIDFTVDGKSFVPSLVQQSADSGQ